MSEAESKREVFKAVTAATLAVAIALGGYSARAATASVSRNEVEAIVETQGPYVADRGVIRLQLAQQTAAIAQLTDKVDGLRAQVAQLNAQLRRR